MTGFFMKCNTRLKWFNNSKNVIGVFCYALNKRLTLSFIMLKNGHAYFTKYCGVNAAILFMYVLPLLNITHDRVNRFFNHNKSVDWFQHDENIGFN